MKNSVIQILLYFFILLTMKNNCYAEEITNNSISSIENIIINGVPIYMIIRGENINNPVLLYLHGGPGRAESSTYFRNMSKGLEKIFTICYMEQRGAGKSYSPDIPPETMTIEQFVEDTRQVSDFLRNKFNKKKIFIFGHSWGSLLGSIVIKKYPELYYAFISTGFPAKQLEAEKLSLDFIEQEATKQNNVEDLKEISNLKLPDINASGEIWYEYIIKQRKLLGKYKGTVYIGDKEEVEEAVRNSTEYSEEEKKNFLSRKGSGFSIILMWNAIMNLNPMKDLSNQKIPVFMIQGLDDRVTSFDLAKKYYNVLNAPFKKFYTFENSAHSPHMEEYERFEKIMKDEVSILAKE
jgi:pimeloyl-ACP methyl ester carboxylesterase